MFSAIARGALLGLTILASGGWSLCAAAEDESIGCTVTDQCCDRLSDWTVRAGVVFLERSRPDDARLVTDSFGSGGAVLLDAADLQFGFEFGPDLTLIRAGECHDLAFRWFQVHDWLASTPDQISPNGAVVQFATPLGNTLLPAAVSSRYLALLDSFELSIERPLIGGWSGLAGIRYIQLDEELAITQDIGLGINTVNNSVDTSNRLLGAQLGARRALGHPCSLWQIDATAKAGIYGVDSASQVIVSQSAGPLDQTFASDSGVAFVGELALSATLPVSDCVSLIAGYQLLWIEGVALAPEQIPVSDPLAGLADIDAGGGVFYHGAILAVQIDW